MGRATSSHTGVWCAAAVVVRPQEGDFYLAVRSFGLIERPHLAAMRPFTAKQRTVSLLAVDARTGRTLWRSAAMPGADEYAAVDPRSSMVLLGVITGEQQRVRLRGLDGADGHTLWSLDADWFGAAGPWLLVQTGGRLRGYRTS